MPIVPVVADIYHGNPVNFTEIAANGIWGVIHKARQGIAVGDFAYAKRQAAAKQAGLLWGGYDFATGDDVATNVADFLAFANLGPQDLAVLDFEDNSQSQMSADQALEFLDRVAQKRGLACGIYGGNRIREQIKPQDKDWIEMAKVSPLWQCRYITAKPADVAEVFKDIPPLAPWTSNFLIQYTGDGSGPTPHTVQGLQNGADLNVFAGSRDELVKAWPGQPVTF